MMETTEIRPEFAEALEAEDWDRLEELWLEALDERPISTAELLEVRRVHVGGVRRPAIAAPPSPRPPRR